MSELPAYTCDDVFRRLDDFLDRALAPDEMRRVREHLDACAACAAEHQFEAKVIASIKDKLQRLQVPDQLLQRIATVLDQHRKQTR